MRNLNARLDSLEKSIGFNCLRPSGMTDEEFVAYWTHMQPRPRATFLHGMSDADLAASIGYLQGIVVTTEEQQHGNT